MPGTRMIKGQPHGLAYMTKQEMEAMNQLKKDSGLRGRLARKGAKKKFNFVDGVPAFYLDDTDYNYTEGPSPSEALAQMEAENSRRGDGDGGGGNSGFDQSRYNALQSEFDKYKAGEEGRNKAAAEKRLNEYRGEQRQQLTGEYGDYKEDYKNLRDRADFSQFRDKFASYGDKADTMAGQAATKYAGYESQINQMPDYASRVAGMGDQMASAGNRMEAMGSAAQGQLQGLNQQIGQEVRQGQAGIRGAQGDIQGYEQAVGQAAGRGEQRAMTAQESMAGARGRMAGIEGRMGDLATQAQDTQGLMKDRGLFAGQLESQRKASEEGNLANIRRSMAASGASPAEIARAEAEARKGGGRAAREDALKASQMAMQSGQSQLGQAGGFLNQAGNMAAQQAGIAGSEGQLGMAGAGMGMQGAQSQAGMAGQRAAMAGQMAGLGLSGAGQQAGNIQAGAGLGMQGIQGNMGAMQGAAGMYGNAQNLGLGKIGAASGMYGTGLAAQQGLMGFGAGMAGQGQASLGSELGMKGGFTGQMAGMTDAQLQDVVAQQNQQFEKEMAEKGYAMQRDAARMSRPRGPSTMDQITGLIGAAAPIIAGASMFSDRNLKKNIKSARNKDLLSPKEIDGFLDSLYAHQYNYKNAKHGKGKQVGVMAQDLEKTQLGKQMVEDTAKGKRVNFGKGLGLVVASQARLNERLNAIGA